MKAVLQAIRAGWCAKIVSGEKTIEVRKTCPNIQPPFKCYIYCTRGNQHAALAILPNGVGRIVACSDWNTAIPCGCYIGNGKVIGEYVCDRIERYALMGTNRHDIAYRRLDAHEVAQDIDLGATCLSAEAMRAYGAGKPLYGWHITQLKIYAEPLPVEALQGKRPPQSWVYVDELWSA